MLARLNEILSPARAAVDRTGNFLRIEGDVDTDRSIKAVDQSGYRAEPTGELEAMRDRWYGVDEVEELSIEESQILADRWIVEAKEEGLVTSQQAESARDPLANTILSSIKEAATTGVPGRLSLDTLTDALAAVLNDEARERIRNWLRDKLG